MSEQPQLAVIGGSGLYVIPGLEAAREEKISTPFGEPSSPIVLGTLAGRRVAFLARHGIGHTIPPSQVNYRANIYALKSLGVRFVAAVSACGSLREDYAPGDVVIPTQLFDFTHLRHRSFFDEPGLVAHVGVADPFCNAFGQQLYKACKKAKAKVHLGGSYITIEGPRFSTRSESNNFRSWGHSIIGMTTSPEAILAREAELCYAVMAHVTDFDVWHAEPVNVEMVISTMQRNLRMAQQAVHNLAASLDLDQHCDCGTALAAALVTDAKYVSEAQRKKLGLLVDKYLSR
ncbi:MAG TPA: S-methyl-5'-thioadenosine phosphorylase [Anaerolineales bacterium]|nr:S-methyl-5'-thioadenosine phosphorylase [Anaerolineales bacterium]